MLLLCALIVGSGTMWAGEVSFIFTGGNANCNETSGTVSGISYETGKTGSANATAYNTTNGLVLYGVTSGGGYFNTTTATSGSITNIAITTNNKKNSPKYTVYGSTNGSDWTQIGNQTNGGSTANFATTAGYTYVKIANTTGSTAQLGVNSIVITYGPAAPSYTITAQSNNTSWGTVSVSGGVITASPVDGCYYADPAYEVTEGTATVSQSGNDFTVTPSSDCTVTINFAATLVTGVTLSQPSLSMSSESSSVQLTATVLPNDASFKTVTWTSSDPSVATVSSTGVVNAVGPGSATITARATNGTDDTEDDRTATCNVSVGSVSYSVALAAGTADAANWSISPTPATAGQTITLSYTGTRTITSVRAVKKPFGLSTFSFATPGLDKSSNLTFTGASTEKPVWFTGKCDTHNTTGTVTYSHVGAGSWDQLYFDGHLISQTGYPYPTTLYITDGLGTKADPFVLSFDEGSPDMELTVTSAGEKSWTITMPASEVEIQVLMPYTVTFGDDNSTLTEASGGAGVTLPSRPNIGSYTFAGWRGTEVTTETTDEPTIINAGEYHPTGDITLYPVYTRTEGSVSEVVDVLNRELTGITGTNYSTWSGKTATSSAVYAGNSAGGNDAIQLRSNNSNSGIVTTTSGGKVKKVSITWNSSTDGARKVNVYGKNSAYSAASDLYNASTQGTNLGTIQCSTNEVLTIAGDYEYIGLRSNSGALYLSEVKITWSSGSFTTYYISKPSVSVTANEGEKDEFWATYYNNDYNVIAPSGTKVFAVKLSGTGITMTEIEDGIVTKGQGVVLKASSSPITLTVNTAASADNYSDNSLQGTMTSIENPGNAYVLNKTEENGVGFYKLKSGKTIGANKAYLTYDGTLGAREFFLFDEATGISTTLNDKGEMMNGKCYDLQGRRVNVNVNANVKKGLYIMNGKKIIIK